MNESNNFQTKQTLNNSSIIMSENKTKSGENKRENAYRNLIYAFILLSHCIDVQIGLLVTNII